MADNVFTWTLVGLLLASGVAHSSTLEEFVRLDINLDGKLTKTEFSKMAEDRRRWPTGGDDRSIDQFTEADSDHDGYLSRSEFSTLCAERAAREER